MHNQINKKKLINSQCLVLGFENFRKKFQVNFYFFKYIYMIIIVSVILVKTFS